MQYQTFIKIQFERAEESLDRPTYDDYKKLKNELAWVVKENASGHLVRPEYPLPKDKAVGGAVPIELWIALIAGEATLINATINQIGSLLGTFLTRNNDLEVSVAVGDNSYSIKGVPTDEAIEIIRKLHAEFGQELSVQTDNVP